MSAFGRVTGVGVQNIDAKSGRSGRAVVRIPPTSFGIALGLSGLSALWVFAGTSFGAPAAFGDALGILAAVVWIGLTFAYLRQGPRRILADARDATVGPLLAAPVMTAYVLAADVLEPHAPGAARTIVIAFLAIGLLVSGLLTGQWMTGGLEEETFGPAFFLPTVGIGFVGADAAAVVGLHSIAELFFGIGIAGWVLISSVALNRLFFRPRLAPSLIPTMAIELAPAAVAGNAYFLIHPGSPDLLLLGLSGYAALMVIAQIRLLPLYRTLSFTPSLLVVHVPAREHGAFRSPLARARASGRQLRIRLDTLRSDHGACRCDRRAHDRRRRARATAALPGRRSCSSTHPPFGRFGPVRSAVMPRSEQRALFGPRSARCRLCLSPPDRKTTFRGRAAA
jgi:tellurite resistance protein